MQSASFNTASYMSGAHGADDEAEDIDAELPSAANQGPKFTAPIAGRDGHFAKVILPGRLRVEAVVQRNGFYNSPKGYLLVFSVSAHPGTPCGAAHGIFLQRIEGQAPGYLRANEQGSVPLESILNPEHIMARKSAHSSIDGEYFYLNPYMVSSRRPPPY
jgi:hypothetical protein